MPRAALRHQPARPCYHVAVRRIILPILALAALAFVVQLSCRHEPEVPAAKTELSQELKATAEPMEKLNPANPEQSQFKAVRRVVDAKA